MSRSRKTSAQLWSLYCSLTKMPKRCCFCNKEWNLSIHHILPIDQGGLDDIANLAFLCEKHHVWLHRNCRTDFEKFFWNNLHPEMRELFEKEQERINSDEFEYNYVKYDFR